MGQERAKETSQYHKERIAEMVRFGSTNPSPANGPCLRDLRMLLQEHRFEVFNLKADYLAGVHINSQPELPITIDGGCGAEC